MNENLKSPQNQESPSKHSLIHALVDCRNPQKRFTREVACFLADNGSMLSLVSDNSAGSVTFDFFGIWQQIKTMPSFPKFVCMIHSHPEDFCHMSEMDKNMVHGWCIALSVPIYYFIVAGPDEMCCVCEKQGDKVVIGQEQGIPGELNESYMNVLFDIMYGISCGRREYSPNELSDIKGIINNTAISIKT